eukprot:3465298-Rhodomonas_salina.1
MRCPPPLASLVSPPLPKTFGGPSRSFRELGSRDMSLPGSRALPSSSSSSPASSEKANPFFREATTQAGEGGRGRGGEGEGEGERERERGRERGRGREGEKLPPLRLRDLQALQ